MGWFAPEKKASHGVNTPILHIQVCIHFLAMKHPGTFWREHILTLTVSFQPKRPTVSCHAFGIDGPLHLVVSCLIEEPNHRCSQRTCLLLFSKVVLNIISSGYARGQRSSNGVAHHPILDNSRFGGISETSVLLARNPHHRRVLSIHATDKYLLSASHRPSQPAQKPASPLS